MRWRKIRPAHAVKERTSRRAIAYDVTQYHEYSVADVVSLSLVQDTAPVVTVQDVPTYLKRSLLDRILRRKYSGPIWEGSITWSGVIQITNRRGEMTSDE